MGLHKGEVYAGNMGSTSRFNYTVLGEAVNIAARMEPLNKVYGTEIIVSIYLICFGFFPLVIIFFLLFRFLFFFIFFNVHRFPKLFGNV